MKSLNKVQLIGHLGNDPEMRNTGAGAAVANLSVATTVRYKDKDTGDSKESTQWHRVVAFGKPAELIGEMFTKGAPIFVEGHLRTRQWQDKDGNDQTTTEIVVDDFIALAKREAEPVPAKKSRSSKSKAAA